MTQEMVRLLIVEDEDGVRESIYRYLKKNSKEIDEIYQASNGEEAMDKIIRYKPDIMLLDIQMPLKDGIAVMKETVAADLRPYTIILSGYDDFQYAQQALRYGAYDYLLKPCRSTEVLSLVDTIAREKIRKGKQMVSSQIEESDQMVSSNQFVNDAMEHIQNHYPEDITLSSVAEKIGISSSYLSSLFTRTLEVSFIEYLNKIRIKRACDYFHDGTMKTYEVAFKVGYNDEKYFSNVFKRQMGMTPSEYRKQMASQSPEFEVF